MKNIARLLFLFVAAAFVFLGQGGVAFGQADQGAAANLNFDHNTTGFILENAHKLVACETCHTGGTFRGTPRTCDTCHTGSGGRAPGKTQTHIPTGAATCDTCHTTVTWSAARMDHRAVANANIACSTCHNNTYSASNAQGMSATHIPTSTSSTVVACDTCHTNTVSFAPANMKHTPDMAGRCNSCHSGAFVAQNALAKSPTHVQTTEQCDVCHKTTTNWFSQSFDHVNADPPVGGRCNTCHNGTRATGKSGNHIPTTAQCDTCHGNTQTFTGGRMNHTGTGGQCSTCHSGSYVAFNALAKPATHLPTTASCDACHQSTTTWLGAVFDHGTASPPVAGRCATCHDGKIAIGQSAATPRHLTTTSSCDTCHTNFTAFAPATMNHLGMLPSVANNCSSCHDGSLVAINAQSKPTTHVATTDQCDSCHSDSKSRNYTTWATGTYPHTGIAFNSNLCGTSCHMGAAGQGLSKPTTHIPTTSSCGTCHNSFIAFAPAVTNHSGMAGPVAAGNCLTCHSGTYTAINALTKPTTHIPTTSQCDTCHTKGFASWAPAVMNHASTAGPAAAGNCANCHAGAYAAQNAQAKPSTHIPTTQSCDSCHGTTAWKPTTFSHSGVSIGGGTCSTCHNGTNALGKAASHLPTSAACDVCHNNFSAFSPALMSHTGTSAPSVAGSCSTCHGGAYLSINAQVKPATHIATSAQCDTCHTGSVSRNYTTWATGTFNHVGVAAGSCATCHNGTTALGKPTTHIPTGATCDTCHTNTTTFAPASMDHANTTSPVAVGNCASCHNGAYVFAKATAKPSTHVPTSAQCDTCHTAGYANWANASYVHSASAVGSCSTCHNGTTALGKPAGSGHIPTTAQCDSCHGNYTAFKPASMNHAGTAGLCSNCHNGSYLVVNALAKSATHVPTGAQCDTCHSNGFVSFSPAPMNHVGTNSPLAAGNCSTCHSGAYTSQNAQDKPSTHVVTTAQCDTCHSGSVSKNYTTWATGTFNHTGVTIGGHACGASCHNGTAGQGLSKPGTHIPTTAACDVCHTNFTAFSPGVMNHVNTAGPAAANNCSSCHSGIYTAVNAQAKPASHITTTDQCDTCHAGSVSGNYTSWATGTFNHAGVTIGSHACGTSCHNGTVNQGLSKSGAHLPTTAACDVCHTNFTAFTPATTNHAATTGPLAAGNCSTCHSGAYVAINAQIKSATHVVTSLQCDICHKSTTSWANASFTHDAGAAGNCATCHNGTTAMGKSSSHIPTTAQCSTCHNNYNAFKPAVMSHAGTAGPAAVGNCATCHGGAYLTVNALSKPATHIPTTNQCDSCHTAGYAAWAPAAMNHTGLAGQCATCHGGAYVSQNAQTKPATHIATAAQCDTCHSGSVSKNYTTWATGVFNHVGVVAGSCVTCHNGTNALGKPGNHIPTTATCDTCHKNYTAFSPASMDHANTAGPVAAANCSTCHNGTYTFANAQTKSATHVSTTAQCDTCHKSTTTWTGASYAHAATAAGTCSTCHNGTTALGKPTLHIPTSAQCDTCHGNYTAFKPASMNHAGTAGQCSTCHNGTYASLNALAKPAGTGHIPTAAQCDTCHNTGFVSFSPATMNHLGTSAPLAAGNCATCHSGTYLAQNAQNMPSTHIATAGAQCDTCHSGSVSKNFTTWATGTFNHAGVVIGGHACGTSCHNGTANQGLSKPGTHIPTTAACDVCHNSFTAFTPATMSHSGTTGPVAAANCVSCHSGTYIAVNAQSKPATHIATTQSCDTCHGTTAWKPTTFSHQGVAIGAGTCATCHGVSALGKSASHLPTTAACDVCHSNFNAFTPATMNHASTAGPLAAGNCATCHSGAYLAINAQVKSATHVATAAQCDTCHKSTSTWANATFTHVASAVVNCASCHNGTTALGKPTTHIPTTAQCSVCHTDTTFTAFKPAVMSHAGTTGPVALANCSTCHGGAYVSVNALSKPTSHIPTSGQCDSCHTGGYAAWSPSTMNHTGLAGQCSTCHSGAYVLQNAQSKPATHIATTAQCDTCHTGSVSGNYTTWATGTFNHAGVVIGAHACGTSCHNGTANQGLSKPSTHIPTTAACDVCHSNFTAFTSATTNHAATTGPVAAGNCATCHSGSYVAVNAQAKPTTHILTTQSCDTCHATTAWKPTTFSHDKLTPAVVIGSGTCATCHGVSALGKSASHIPTTAACDVCHTNFTAFTPATTNHGSTSGPVAAGNCSTCHSGTYAALNPQIQIKSATHVVTALQCDTCHKSTSSWANATFTHDASAAGNCATCHNGATALGKLSSHIPTTAQCSTCHNNYNAFKPAVMSHTGTTGPAAVGNCATCHGGAYLTVNALNKPATHIPTNSQCDSCHTAGYAAWSPSTMNHTGLAGQCSTCHGGAYLAQNAQTKPATHIATAAQCDTCHSASVTKNYTTWATGVFNHVGVVAGSCVTCHNGTNALGKPANHIPTTATCDTCHKNFTAFNPASMDHAATVGPVAAANCSTCHNGNYTFANAQTKSATHVSTTAQCDTCHKSTTVWTGASYAHAATAAGTCSTCHNGTTALGKPAGTGHIPTTAQCDTCHGNYTAFKPASMNHAGTAGQCSTCHNGTYATQNALAKPAGTGHIPTGAQCDTCHNNGFVSFAPAPMNHLGTNTPVATGNCSTCHGGAYTAMNAQAKPATHLVTAAQCDTCHSGSVSKNYTTWATGTFNHVGVVIGAHACGTSCHTGAAGQGLSKPATHIPTTAACDVCHTNFTAFNPATMSHSGTTGPLATGNCATCHSGTYVAANAQAKPVTHIPTTQSCDTCHGTTAWKPTTFSHQGITMGGGTCGTCHGTTALGKSASHLPTTAACDVCHTNFTAFNPATMNHASTAGPLAAGNCATCHSGAYLAINAQVKSATHVTTTAQCDTCHKSTSTWANATFTHDASAVGKCSTCHNGATALGKPTTHIPTTAQCSTCHNNYTAFKPAVMSHTGTTGPVAVANCATCHGGAYVAVNALNKPATHIPTASQCDSCHKSGYVAWAPATMNHTGLAGQCSTCHSGAYVSQNAQSKPTTHIVTTAQCDTCHSGSVSGNYTTWATGTFNHAGVVIGGHACGTSCHTGAVGQGLSKPGTHIPTTAACDVCHTNFTAFNPATMTHVATAGLVIAGNCNSCHNGSYLSANAQAKTATHITTTQSCDACHKSTAAWLPVTFTHGVADTNCVSCHDGIKATGKPAIHIPPGTLACSACHRQTAWLPLVTPFGHTGIATGCSNCHTNAYPSIDVKPANHVPTTAGCETCHTTNLWSPNKAYAHTGVAKGTCASCHTGTYLGVPGKVSNHIPTTTPAGMPGNECSLCHTSTAVGGFATEKMNHGTMQTSCATCHDKTSPYLGSMDKITRGSGHHNSAGKDCSSSGCHKPLGNQGSAYTRWN